VKDLALFEECVSLFLLLFFLRPFVRALQGAKGLSFFPLIALGLGLLSIPAFGFRPESIPLYGVALFACIRSLPELRQRSSRSHGRGQDGAVMPFGILGLGLTILSVLFAFAFCPSVEPLDSNVVGGVETRAFKVSWGQGSYHVSKNLRVRMWLPPEVSEGAAVLLVPPVSGGMDACANLAAALALNGHPVLSFSIPGRDLSLNLFSPHGLPGLKALYEMLRVSLAGSSEAKAAALGAEMERERAAAIEFLADRISALDIDAFADLRDRISEQPMVLIGVGMGGGSVIDLASRDDAATRYRYAVSIESPFYSAYSAPEQKTLIVKNLRQFLQAMKSQRTSLKPSLPDPRIPLLFIESYHVRDLDQREGRYNGIIRILRASPEGSFLISNGDLERVDLRSAPDLYPVYGLFSSSAGRAVAASVPSRLSEIIRTYDQPREPDTQPWSEIVTRYPVEVETPR